MASVSSASSSPQPATSTEFNPSIDTTTSSGSNTQHSPNETDPADPFVHPESNVDFSVNTSPSQKPRDEPFVSYSRRVLVFLSKSPLVSPPPAMPSLKDWFGEWSEPHTSPKKDSEHASSSGGLANGRHRLRRDQTEDDSRPSYKSQFSQASQMGNFRHHSSRLDEKGDRDAHQSLRNLSDTYDRNRLLGASSVTSRRDSAPHLPRGTPGIATTLPSNSTRRGELDRDRESTVKDKDGKEATPRDRMDQLAKERRDAARGEKSEDWRRAERELDTDAADTYAPTSERGKEHRSSRLRSRSRDVPARAERYRERERGDRIHEHDERDWERTTRGSGRAIRQRSPSPVLPPVSARTDRWVPPRPWESDSSRTRDDGRERESRGYDRRGRNDLDDRGADDHYRHGDHRGGPTNGRDRRPARDSDRDREDDRKSDARGKDRGTLEKEKEREPAWMGDYVPESGDSILGGRGQGDDLDELQVWKRDIKEKERAAAGVEDASPAVQPSLPDDGLDDIQRFKLRIKEEQEKRERAARESASPNDLARLSAPPVPPGLPLVPPPSSALTEKNENISALAALLSPLKSTAPTNDISSSPTTHFPANMDSLTQNSILTSGQSPSSSLAPPNSRYPDLSPNRQGIAFQSPLTVAGLTPAEPTRAHEQNRARSDAGPSAAPPALALDIRAASASHVPISQPTPQSTNGRSTPTMSGFSSQIDSVRGTSAASSSQSSVVYNGNGDGSSSPGSGSAQPSYAQGKGSRFAKFWDNKPKDQAQVASPQQAQPPSQISGSSSSSSQGWPSNAQLPSDLRGSRSLAQPRQISAGSDHGSLNGLFPNLNIGAPFERHDRAASGLNGGVPDSDRMQNLLSMLSPQQVRPSSRTQDNVGPMFRQQLPPPPILQNHPPISLNLQQAPQYQHQSNGQPQLPFSPIGSPDLDRGFVPDGMVPGLRPQRTRESSGNHLSAIPPMGNSLGDPLFSNDDDRAIFNVQRLPSHQQAFDQLHSRPVPALYSNHAPGSIPVSARNVNSMTPGTGGFGPPQTGLRHSPNPVQQQPQPQPQQAQQQQPTRGFNNTNIAIGRSNFDLPLNPNFNGNLGGGGMMSGNILPPQQQYGGFNPNGPGSLGGQNGPPRSLSLGQPHNLNHTMGLGNIGGGGGFPNQPGSLEFAVQHQRELQARQLMSVQQQQQISAGIRGNGSANNINIGRLMQQPNPQGLPSHHAQFHQQQQQQQTLRQQQQHSVPQGLPFNMLVSHQLGHQQLLPHQHSQQPQQQPNLGGGGDFGHGSLPLPQHQHQPLGGFSMQGQGNNGLGGPQTQTDLMALLMGGGHHR